MCHSSAFVTLLTEKHGQIYISQINTLLALGCIALVIGFREKSQALASAYGIAVTLTDAGDNPPALLCSSAGVEMKPYSSGSTLRYPTRGGR